MKRNARVGAEVAKTSNGKGKRFQKVYVTWKKDVQTEKEEKREKKKKGVGNYKETGNEKECARAAQLLAGFDFEMQQKV